MNANDLSELIAAILILVGSIFIFLSAVGLVRLPDIYTRAHAASKSSTMGVMFTLVGTLLFFVLHEGFFSIRLILGIFFVFLTAPVSAHVILRSAYRSNVALAETSVQDDLRKFKEKAGNE